MNAARSAGKAKRAVALIAVVLIMFSVFTGCAGNVSIESARDGVETPLQEVDAGPTKEPDPASEPTPEPTPIPEPTNEPDPSDEEPENKCHVCGKTLPEGTEWCPICKTHVRVEYAFQDLPEEEFNDAYAKLLISDPNDTLNAGSFFAAGFLVDGIPHIMYGTVLATGEEGVFRFNDLFTGQELFSYHTSNPQGDPRTRSGQEWVMPMFRDRLEYEGIHPYFCKGNIDLCFVDLSYQASNFLEELGYGVFDDLDYVNKYIPESSKVTWTVFEYAQSYLNFIPSSMWVTGEDLESARN